MAATVGYIFEELLADPAISEMAVTSGGPVLAARAATSGVNELLCPRLDVDRNGATPLNATLGVGEDVSDLFSPAPVLAEYALTGR